MKINQHLNILRKADQIPGGKELLRKGSQTFISNFLVCGEGRNMKSEESKKVKAQKLEFIKTKQIQVYLS